MKNTEVTTLGKIKELLGISTSEQVENVEVENVEEVVLNEEVKEEPKQEEAQEVAPAYVTEQQLSDVRNELLSMLKVLIEETKKDMQEVPQELSSEKEEVKEEVELSEVEEIVHSPENEVERKEVKFSKPMSAMTPQERIYAMLNN